MAAAPTSAMDSFGDRGPAGKAATAHDDDRSAICSHEKEPSLLTIALAFLLITLGGLHYGYNIAIVGAALPALAKDMQVDTLSGETLAACTLLGAILGSPLSGSFADQYGRRLATIIGETLSLCGTVGCALSGSPVWMIAFRFVVGLGVGFCTLCKPIYVVETISPRLRGTILASFSPAIAVGILLAQMVQLIPNQGWREQLAMGGVMPFLLLMLAVFAMPESEVWLQMQRSRDQLPIQANELPDGQKAREGHATCMNELWYSRSGRRAAVLASCLGAAMQGTGDYAALVYTSVYLAPFVGAPGLETSRVPGSMLMAVSLMNLLGALSAVWVIDKFGRKRCMLVGLGGMGACSLLMTIFLLTPTTSLLGPMLIAMCAFAFIFQIGPGCGYFVMITEVSPPHLKTQTYSLGNAMKYSFELVVSWTFLSLCQGVGTASVIAAFTAVSVVCFFCISSYVVERRREVDGRTVFDLSETWASLDAADRQQCVHWSEQFAYSAPAAASGKLALH